MPLCRSSSPLKPRAACRRPVRRCVRGAACHPWVLGLAGTGRACSRYSSPCHSPGGPAQLGMQLQSCRVGQPVWESAECACAQAHVPLPQSHATRLAILGRACLHPAGRQAATRCPAKLWPIALPSCDPLPCLWTDTSIWTLPSVVLVAARHAGLHHAYHQALAVCRGRGQLAAAGQPDGCAWGAGELLSEGGFVGAFVQGRHV